MATMNFVDIIIIAIFLISIGIGLARGFVSEIISLATLIAAFIVAIMFSNTLASFFTGSSSGQGLVTQTSTVMGVSTAQPISYIAIAISFGLLFAGTILLGTLVKMLLNVAVQTGVLGIGNRLFGGVFGCVRGFLINLVLIFLVQLSPLSNESWWLQSQLVPAFQPAVVWLGNIVSPALSNLEAQLNSALQNLSSEITTHSNF